MRYSSRFFLWAPFALLVALGLGVSARWWSVAHQLSAKLDALNHREVIPGVKIDFASKSLSGYPFNVDTVFHDLTVTVAGPHGPIVWHSENFASHALTFGGEHWIYEAAGHQRLTWTDSHGRQHSLAFEVGSLHASASLSDMRLERFDADLVGFDSPALAIARTQVHARRNPAADQLDLIVELDEMHLSPPLRGACGETVGHLKIDGNFSDGSAFRAVLAGNAPWQSGLDAWRKQGARFFLAQGDFACGSSSTFVQGQLGLDDQKRPRGLLTAQIAGFAALRDGAAHANAKGGFVTALLDQSAEPNPTAEGRVTVRALFRDGLTYLGSAPAGMNGPLY
ncbi:MAG TPA: DUF2125 domain-containing protein [Rhizomicrobium sp.]|jgi:hypothetical protein